MLTVHLCHCILGYFCHESTELMSRRVVFTTDRCELEILICSVRRWKAGDEHPDIEFVDSPIIAFGASNDIIVEHALHIDPILLQRRSHEI